MARKSPRASTLHSGTLTGVLALAIIVGLLAVPTAPLWAGAGAGAVAGKGAKGDAWRICRLNAGQAEREYRIPQNLLQAVALAESGRWNQRDQARIAWPWTVYAEGRGRYLPSREAALAEIDQLRDKGITNIDVGCMQINLHHHGDAFDSVDDMLDPARNTDYAARFLRDLHQESRAWSIAVAHYHSRTPKHANSYRRRVLKLWPVAARQAALARSPAAAPTRAVQAAATPSAPVIQRDTRTISRARPAARRGVYQRPGGRALRIMGNVSAGGAGHLSPSGAADRARLLRTGGRPLAMPSRDG